MEAQFVTDVNKVLAPDGLTLLQGPVEGFMWPVINDGEHTGRHDVLFDSFKPKTTMACTVPRHIEVTVEEMVFLIRRTFARHIAELTPSL